MSKTTILKEITCTKGLVEALLHASFKQEDNKIKVIACQSHPIIKVPMCIDHKMCIQKISTADIESFLNGFPKLLKKVMHDLTEELFNLTGYEFSKTQATYTNIKNLKENLYLIKKEHQRLVKLEQPKHKKYSSQLSAA